MLIKKSLLDHETLNKGHNTTYVISFKFEQQLHPLRENLLRKSLYSVQTRENTVPKKLRIWTLFTECRRISFNQRGRYQ